MLVIPPTSPSSNQAPSRNTYCGGCLELVPEAEVIGYPHAGPGTNTPLCPSCARMVTCDTCQRAHPIGLCWIGREDVITCNPCVERWLQQAPANRERGVVLDLHAVFAQEAAHA